MVTRRGASTNYDASADQTGTHAQEPHPFNANHTFCISSTVPSCNNSNHHSRSNSDVATTVPPLILLSAIHPNSSTTQNATSNNATTGSSSISCKRYRGVRNMMGLFAMSFGYAFVSTTMFTLLVPREIERLRPHRTSLWLGMLMGISALCQMTSPLFGAWSDRVARRGFFLFLGTTISIIGVGMFLSLSFYEAWGGRTILAVLLLFTGSATLTIGLTAQYAIVTSLLSDCVVEDQVGKGSGVLAVLTFLGSGVGYGLFALKASPESLYMMFVSVSALCFLITWHNLPATLDTYLAHRKMIRFSESSHTSHIVSPSSNRSKSAMQYHHYITPHLLTPKRGWCRSFIDLIQHAYVFPDMMEHRDFFYACAARALFNVGLSAQVFLVYYYRDIMNETDPLHVLSYVCVAVLFGSVIAALPSGILSDSIGKKPLIYFSVSLCITCVILFVTSRSVTAHLYIAVLYGIGNVAFLSLDYALGVQTLPRPVPSTNYNQNQSSPTQTYPLNYMDPNLITEHTGLMTSNPMEVVESPERAASAYGMDLHGCNGTVHRSHTLVAHAHSVSSTSAITEPRDSGKDLGIFSMSSTIGQLIGQVMYGLLLDSFRIEGAATTSTNSIPSLPGTLGDGANDTSRYFYEGFLFVYACCCISFASAGVCVYRIRGVK